MALEPSLATEYLAPIIGFGRSLETVAPAPLSDQVRHQLLHRFRKAGPAVSAQTFLDHVAQISGRYRLLQRYKAEAIDREDASGQLVALHRTLKELDSSLRTIQSDPSNSALSLLSLASPPAFSSAEAHVAYLQARNAWHEKMLEAGKREDNDAIEALRTVEPKEPVRRSVADILSALEAPLQELRTLCEAAVQLTPPRQRGRRPARLRSALVCEIASAFTEHFGRAPSRTRGGPFEEIVRFALQGAGFPITEDVHKIITQALRGTPASTSRAQKTTTLRFYHA